MADDAAARAISFIAFDGKVRWALALAVVRDEKRPWSPIVAVEAVGPMDWAGYPETELAIGRLTIERSDIRNTLNELERLDALLKAAAGAAGGGPEAAA